MTMATVDPRLLAAFIDDVWDSEIVPTLVDYIRIPSQSPHFDPDWASAGHMDRAVDMAAAWCRARDVAGLSVEVVRLPGRTPVLWLEIPGEGPGNVLLYGHLDKQPPMEGWDEDKGPWLPVLTDGKLYGRGGADDGYAVFASLTAIEALQRQGVPHARCVVLIECCEESGSFDLPANIEHLAPRLEEPDLVVCLDSGCANYDTLWCTTSLRGMVLGTLTVSVTREGIHSGDGSGIVPDSFRIARALVGRLEDAATGRILLDGLSVDIPAGRIEQAEIAAAELGVAVAGKYPLLAGVSAMAENPIELILNRTWRPALTITGAGGLPPLATAGNVLRPTTSLKLSLRLPPRCDARAASALVKRTLEADPPHGASVHFETEEPCDGWDAPPLAAWLAASIEAASQTVFGRPACAMGEGGTIPLMAMLGEAFPAAQFLITGVLGPASNAHGPNEFLHIAMGKRLTACVSLVLSDHYRESSS